MKIAAISGVTGQIGSYLAEFLLNKGYFVVGLKRRTSTINSTTRINHLLSNKNLQLEYFDFNDPISVFNIFTKYKIDEFYNLGCMSHVRVSFDLPEEAINTVTIGTLRILESIRRLSPTTKLYSASSSEQYGINPDLPFNELSKFMPASPYGCAKEAAHNLVVHYRNAYNLHASCGIVFNTESPRRGENFVTRKITLGASRIKAGLQEELVMGNIKSLRDWSYAPEICEGMWRMLQQQYPDDYVLCSEEMHSVEDFLKETFEYAGLGNYEKYVRINPIYFRAQEVPKLIGDCSKAKTVLGFESKTKFKELVKIMYNADYELVTKGIQR